MTPGRRSHEQPASDGGATAGSGERAAETAADASLFTFFQKKDSEFRALDRDELLTVEEVAQLLGVSRSWIYEHTRSRGTPRSERLPHIKLGKYVRFDARAIRAFLEQKCRLM